jgi:hypothetical protein
MLTLNVSNALLENLLENLGVLEFLLDLANDALGKLALFALLDLALVADPGVENLLGLGSESSALLEFVGLSLKLGGFLNNSSITDRTPTKNNMYKPWRPRRVAW